MNEDSLRAVVGPTFTITSDQKSITCHVCRKTSYHPGDVEQRFCGYCHKFHVDMVPQRPMRDWPLRRQDDLDREPWFGWLRGLRGSVGRGLRWRQ